MPVIPAPSATTIPAVPERTYGRLKLVRVEIVDDVPGNPNAPIVCSLKFRKARVVGDPPNDLWDLSPNPEDADGIALRLEDLLAEAVTRAMAGKPKLADALACVLDFVQEYAAEKLVVPEAPP